MTAFPVAPRVQPLRLENWLRYSTGLTRLAYITGNIPDL
jgi:hypothetical protein